MERGFLAVALAIIGAALIAIIVVVFGIGVYLSPQDPLQPSDAIVAISGGETNARTDEAVKLYQQEWARTIIFSGAALDPTGPSNAAAMRARAISEGVPSSAILIEEKSTSTKENADFVAQIVKQNSFKRIILVTSPYHQKRASLTFGQALGPYVKIINHSAVDSNWRRSHWWANPTSLALTLSELQKMLFISLGGKP